MPATQDLIRKKRSSILEIAGRHGARNLRIFGSVARGEAGPESDLALLGEMEPGRGPPRPHHTYPGSGRVPLGAGWMW